VTQYALEDGTYDRLYHNMVFHKHLSHSNGVTIHILGISCKEWKQNVDIHSKIMTANHAELAHIKCFRPNFLPWNTNLKLYKALI